MPWLAAAAAVAAPVIGGMIGGAAADKERAAAAQARAQALAQFAGIKPPSIEEQQLNLQQYQSQGQVNPLLEQLVQQGDTRLSDISLDPRLRAEQMSALQQMSGMASGQIQPGDVAAMELSRRNAAAEAQAKQGQILQEMQQRGQAGSGAELMARLKASQSGADMLSQSQMQQAKIMQEARIQALQAQSNMASGLRSQDYGQQTDLGRARDTIANFNAQNSQNVQNRNVSSQNQAQLANLTNRQNIANMNVESGNKQQITNKGLIQSNFENQLNLGNARAGQYNSEAASRTAQAGQTAGMWAGIGQGVGTGLAAFGQNSNTTATPKKGP